MEYNRVMTRDRSSIYVEDIPDKIATVTGDDERTILVNLADALDSSVSTDFAIKIYNPSVNLQHTIMCMIGIVREDAKVYYKYTKENSLAINIYNGKIRILTDKILNHRDIIISPNETGYMLDYIRDNIQRYDNLIERIREASIDYYPEILEQIEDNSTSCETELIALYMLVRTEDRHSTFFIDLEFLTPELIVVLARVTRHDINIVAKFKNFSVDLISSIEKGELDAKV